MNNTSNNKEQPNSSLSIDPGILEMGASVSVNDEMRRSLATETAEIDAVCTKLLSEVQTEESQSTELKKSQSHADMELSGMLQSAKELVDTMHMNEQVFRDLQSKVETDLEKTVIQKHDSESSINDTKTHSPTSVLGIQQSIHQKQEHVTAICQDIQHIKAEIQNWESQSNHLMEEKAVLQNKIKSEHLKITLANHKHKTQILEDLLKDTQIRRHTQKAACELIQARIETLSETLRTAESELQDKKQASAEAEQTMKQEMLLMENEKKAATKISQDLQQEMDKLDEKNKKLEVMLTEARQLIQKRETTKVQLHQVRGERRSLYSTKMDLQAQISAMQKELEGIERDKIKEEKSAEKIAQKKLANDAFEMDVMLADLKAKEAQLAELDEFLQAPTYPEKERLSEAIEAKKQELEQLKESIDSAKVDKEEKECTLKEYHRIFHDNQDGYQKEYEKHKTLLKEEHETIAALELQIQQQKQVEEYEHGYILRKAKLYKYAADYLKKLKEKETKVSSMKGKSSL